jgi:hypothetical protein
MFITGGEQEKSSYAENLAKRKISYETYLCCDSEKMG